MTKPFKGLFIAGLFFFITNISFAQSDMIAAINGQIIPLKTLEPGADLADLQKLKPILKDKEIIGLGEATHGTHEFFLFKHRMLQFLVKEMGVKAFIMEGDFAGAQAMNDYVVNGKGTVDKGLQGVGFGIWMTQEVVDMANWLKAYNATQPAENKVRFFGCDMQWGSSAMAMLKEYLTPTNQFTPEMEVAYAATKLYAPSLNSKDKAAIKGAVNSLNKIKFTEGDTAMYRHYVRELQQFIIYIDAQSTLFPAKQSDVRDKCMAENVEWIANYMHHSKVMVWAHNGHINKTAGSDGYKRMGMYLANDLKDKYYAMGFDFNNGSMRSFDMKQRKNVAAEMPKARPGSSGDVFAQCAEPNFILDFKSASADPLVNTFLNTNIASVFYGAQYNGEAPHYVTHKLAETFDAMIFIRDTHAAMDEKQPDVTK
ncbi:MAG: erythromycin esterase family protein [Bacteroidota bacterium]